MSAAQELQNDLVILEPVSEAIVDLLVRWTLDPVAQGPYKRVPETSAAQLRDLFLHEQSREYFVIRVIPDGTPVGRFYWRAWRFTPDPDAIDWELNIFLAEPGVRGRGLGSSSQGLAVQYLLGRQSTRSVFAYTAAENHAERRALQKAGLQELGPFRTRATQFRLLKESGACTRRGLRRTSVRRANVVHMRILGKP